jgi:hypothetical protein
MPESPLPALSGPLEESNIQDRLKVITPLGKLGDCQLQAETHTFEVESSKI